MLGVLLFRPCTRAQLARAEASLGARLPDALRSFYARHDGLLHYESGGGLGLGVHGVDRANVLTGDAAGGPSEFDRAELRDYLPNWAEAPPIAFETNEFREWVLESGDGEPYEAVRPGFPQRYACFACDWATHASYWVELDGRDGPVYVAPSPRFSSASDIAASLREPLLGLPAFLAAAIGGRAPR